VAWILRIAALAIVIAGLFFMSSQSDFLGELLSWLPEDLRNKAVELLGSHWGKLVVLAGIVLAAVVVHSVVSASGGWRATFTAFGNLLLWGLTLVTLGMLALKYAPEQITQFLGLFGDMDLLPLVWASGAALALYLLGHTRKALVVAAAVAVIVAMELWTGNLDLSWLYTKASIWFRNLSGPQKLTIVAMAVIAGFWAARRLNGDLTDAAGLAVFLLAAGVLFTIFLLRDERGGTLAESIPAVNWSLPGAGRVAGSSTTSCPRQGESLAVGTGWMTINDGHRCHAIVEAVGAELIIGDPSVNCDPDRKRGCVSLKPGESLGNVLKKHGIRIIAVKTKSGTGRINYILHPHGCQERGWDCV
jgi:hypothetical protein